MGLLSWEGVDVISDLIRDKGELVDQSNITHRLFKKHESWKVLPSVVAYICSFPVSLGTGLSQ